jgi:tRNA threonylcarbamoyladenosine biosynthesis protein TsaB
VALILNIETATKTCSVALAKDGVLIGQKSLSSGAYSHAENLHPFIDSLLKEHQINPTDLDAISISMGPGSYTGLRIGVSTAKGLCYALNIPLLSVSSTELLALAAPKTQHVISVLDARRMEVYVEVRNRDGEIVLPVQAMVAEVDFMHELLEQGECVFIGDAAEKLKSVVTHPNARFVQRFPSAEFMGVIAGRKYSDQETENVAYFEPFYLKDFVAGAPRKML